MLALLTQRLAKKIFARQDSGTQHRRLSEGERSTLFPLLQNINTASPERTPSSQPLAPTDLAQTNVLHAWLHCSYSHTHTHMCAARWVKRQVSHLMKRHLHTNRLCLCRERPLLFHRTMSLLTFLCLHIFKHQKQQKEREKKHTQSERHAAVATDKFRLIQAFLSWSQTIFYSTVVLGSLECPTVLFDEDMFERLASLSPTRHLSHTRGISLFGDDEDDVQA